MSYALIKRTAAGESTKSVCAGLLGWLPHQPVDDPLLRWTMRLLLTVAGCLFTSSLVFAQDPRIPVSVWHHGDEVGQQLVFALKEAMRESGSFRFVDHEIAPRSPRIVVYLATIKGDTAELSTAVGTTVVYDHVSIPGLGIFLTTGVTSCERDRVENCAKEIMPNIDLAVEYLRRGWPDLWKSLIAGGLEFSQQQTPKASPAKPDADRRALVAILSCLSLLNNFLPLRMNTYDLFQVLARTDVGDFPADLMKPFCSSEIHANAKVV